MKRRTLLPGNSALEILLHGVLGQDTVQQRYQSEWQADSQLLDDILAAARPRLLNYLEQRGKEKFDAADLRDFLGELLTPVESVRPL